MIESYQALAMRTSQWQPGTDGYRGEQHRRYAAMSLVGESGEVVDALKKCLAGQDVPREKILLELGDVAWSIACVCEVQGYEFAQALGYAEHSAVSDGDEFHLALTLSKLASRAGESLYVDDLEGDNDCFFDGSICFVALTRTLGFTLDEVLAANIDKLSKRYASGSYSHEASIARADVEGVATANHRCVATVGKGTVSTAPEAIVEGE